MSEDGRITIRSYRVCFAFERRIHRLDRWRIPVPFGVPLRGVAYAAAVLVALLALSRLPLAGAAIGALHPALRFVAIPLCSAVVLVRLELDGRPAHVALGSWLRYRLGPRYLVAFRAAPAATQVQLGAVALAPDEAGPRLRRGVVAGPATVVLRYPVRTRARGRALHVAQRPGRPAWRGKQVELAPGARMVLR